MGIWPILLRHKSARRDHELIAVRIFKREERAPRLFLRRAAELNSARAQFVIRLLRIVAMKRGMREGSNMALVPLRREENHSRLRAGNRKLDPSLLAVERLVSQDAEPELVGVERKGAILVAYRDANEFDAFDHAGRIAFFREAVNAFFIAILLCTIVPKTIGIDDYVLDVLMRDLVAHDRAPSAFLVYLHLWRESERSGITTVKASHQTMAECTGLSKTAVQNAVRRLVERKLLRAQKSSVTAVPEYRVLKPWRR